ncbi:hypothetical protein UFOVP242_215 [uncultured Caudovirales phage]|uniref:Uncharacterized protein n=1 Tax=uncultured Caudovirales phage TaxID=2100421 RepID=A0A6J7WVJ8_9CAUD|nr:hypothetical protein UFOVP242_215 [uncultured Caudovirales phage]
MKVYLVLKGFEYEGEDVVKVFLRKEAAEEYRSVLEAADEGKYYDFTVAEHEVME